MSDKQEEIKKQEQEQEISDKHAKKKAEKEAKAAAKKAEKEAKKKAKEEGVEYVAEKKEEPKKEKRAQEGQAFQKDENDMSAHLFGDLEINRSASDPAKMYERVYTKIEEIDESMVGKDVWVRARAHMVTGKGKIVFIILRQQFATVQATTSVSDTVSQHMIKYLQKVHKESIIDCFASVVEADVQKTSQKQELQIKEFWTVNKSAPRLPFEIDNASVRVEDQTLEGRGQEGEEEEKKEEGKEDEKTRSLVNQKVRLDNRVIDLRVPSNQALMRIQSGVCQLFREFLYKNGFTEIHTPKLLGGSSEGGANVFTLKYFGQDSCLAQSPQLYKQMALAADMERVFEIGPVFRAENSNTYRHLCEFTGLDMEMTFKTHYFEVLDILAEMLIYIFNNLETRYAKELKVVSDQYPFEPFVCKSPVVKFHFKEGVKLLQEAGFTQDPLEDLTSETEKALGKIVKEKYETDFYMLYGYPVNARPFYTMLDPNNPGYTNSYDFFMRGEEITSGAQRVHDPELLAQRASECGIPPETIQGYIDAFKFGISQHAGAGFGLERIVKFYCNIQNIRKCSMFPRDPKRLTP